MHVWQTLWCHWQRALLPMSWVGNCESRACPTEKVRNGNFSLHVRWCASEFYFNINTSYRTCASADSSNRQLHTSIHVENSFFLDLIRAYMNKYMRYSIRGISGIVYLNYIHTFILIFNSVVHHHIHQNSPSCIS